MEARDRLTNLGLLGAAAVAWLAVWLVLTTRDPRADPAAGPAGAIVIGLALGLSAVPLFWLAGFARQRRIAYRGDWTRAIRRGAWVGGLAAIFVILSVVGIEPLPVGLFILALAVVAETTLSASR
jgi:hypothetical protein